MHRSLFFVQVSGNFQGTYVDVGNARHCCDERSQSQRNQKSPFQEKVTYAELRSK